MLCGLRHQSMKRDRTGGFVHWKEEGRRYRVGRSRPSPGPDGTRGCAQLREIEVSTGGRRDGRSG